MLKGLRRFFDDPDQGDFLPDVEEICLLVFTDPDAEIVKREVQAFVLESPPPCRRAGPSADAAVLEGAQPALR